MCYLSCFDICCTSVKHQPDLPDEVSHRKLLLWYYSELLKGHKSFSIITILIPPQKNCISALMCSCMCTDVHVRRYKAAVSVAHSAPANKIPKPSFVLVVDISLFHQCVSFSSTHTHTLVAVKCQQLQRSDTVCGGFTERDDCLCYQC